MTKTDIWKAIAEGWRAVTVAEQAGGGGGGGEDALIWLNDIEPRLHEIEAQLVSTPGVWSEEGSEIEDLVFEITYNARPHAEQAIERYAERDRREAKAQEEATTRSHHPEAVN
jgi:hypothetical protein